MNKTSSASQSAGNREVTMNTFKKNPQLAKGSGRFGINSTYVYVHACTHTRADTLLCVVSVVVFQENLLGGGIARDEP